MEDAGEVGGALVGGVGAVGRLVLGGDQGEVTVRIEPLAVRHPAGVLQLQTDVERELADGALHLRPSLGTNLEAGDLERRHGRFLPARGCSGDVLAAPRGRRAAKPSPTARKRLPAAGGARARGCAPLAPAGNAPSSAARASRRSPRVHCWYITGSSTRVSRQAESVPATITTASGRWV